MRNIKKKATKSFAQYGEVLRTRKNMNHSFRGKCKRELLKVVDNNSKVCYYRYSKER